MKILAIVGSLQQRSSNRVLVELAGRCAPAGAEWRVSQSLAALPHYNADLDGDPPLEAVAHWRAELDWADAVFIASPEYGHFMPGCLKNALDWIVGSGNFGNKPVAVTCASAIAERGRLGLASLAEMLRVIDAVVVYEEPIVVNRRAVAPDGGFEGDGVRAAIDGVFAELARAVVTRGPAEACGG